MDSFWTYVRTDKNGTKHYVSHKCPAAVEQARSEDSSMWMAVDASSAEDLE